MLLYDSLSYNELPPTYHLLNLVSVQITYWIHLSTCYYYYLSPVSSAITSVPHHPSPVSSAITSVPHPSPVSSAITPVQINFWIHFSYYLLFLWLLLFYYYSYSKLLYYIFVLNFIIFLDLNSTAFAILLVVSSTPFILFAILLHVSSTPFILFAILLHVSSTPFILFAILLHVNSTAFSDLPSYCM